jgi:hypothetical protein
VIFNKIRSKISCLQEKAVLELKRSGKQNFGQNSNVKNKKN